MDYKQLAMCAPSLQCCLAFPFLSKKIFKWSNYVQFGTLGFTRLKLCAWEGCNISEYDIISISSGEIIILSLNLSDMGVGG